MTKKLFVVLVVIAALLVSFSLVIAKKAPQSGTKERPFEYQKPILSEKVEALSMPGIATVPGIAPTVYQLEGLPVQKPKGSFLTREVSLQEYNRPSGSGKDYCDLYGSYDTWIEEWIWGDGEWYANFQEPYEYGCVDVFPFYIWDVYFVTYLYATQTFYVRGIIYENAGTDCPIPGDEICGTPTYEVTLDAGAWLIGLEFAEGDTCCVYEPYFAGLEFLEPVDPYIDAYTGSGGEICQTYTSYDQVDWYDLVDLGYFPGMMMLATEGSTRLQNDCPEEPVCCQFDGYCDYLTPTDCIDAGGIPAHDARYECIDDVCMLPWEGPACDAVVEPFLNYVCAGDEATYEVTVEFTGGATSCLLSVTPDPACTDCGTAVFTPNPVVSPATTSTLTIQTAATTPAGRYEFEVNGAGTKGFMTYLQVTAPGDECKLQRDWGSGPWWYTSGWDAGDKNAIYMDPAALCVCCDEVYPYYLHTIEFTLYDHAGVGTADIILHLYEVQDDDPCLGPGAEFYSQAVDGIDQFYVGSTDPASWVQIPLDEKICITEPFWLGLTYNSGLSGEVPSLFWDQTLSGDLCSQAAYYSEAWHLWEDVFGMDGYLTLRTYGTCASAYCAPGETCDMWQELGLIGSITTGFEEGEGVVKYFDPEDYCDPIVYPYKIDDLYLLFYDWAGAEAVDISVLIYTECQDSCDGPGSPIYESGTISLTTDDFYPNWAHIILDDVICMYEPFFIGFKYMSGTAGSTPSLVFDRINLMYPDFYVPDTCHTWYWRLGADYWIEHWDHWLSPDSVGYPFIEVSGFTEHGDCAPPSCSEDLEVIAGGVTPTWYSWIPGGGRNYPNQRFQMPLGYGGRLDEFHVKVHYLAEDFHGTPDPVYYVWLSDGQFPLDDNPPYQAIGEFPITYEDIIWYPNPVVIDCHEREWNFGAGEMFHIGFQPALEPDDTLSYLMTDDQEGEENRFSYWGAAGAWREQENARWLLIDALICPAAPEGSTFTLKCRPSLEVATPGDPAEDLFSIVVGQTEGYPYPVNLTHVSTTPPEANIHVNIHPNDQVPECTSYVEITVDPGVGYDDYVLSFQGAGTDGQVRTCDVTLRVQPPYDYAIVEFDHGYQSMGNNGGFGETNGQNFFFENFGDELICDGSFISMVPGDPQEDHFAMDMFDCENLGYTPWDYIPDFPPWPWCYGTPTMEWWGYMMFTEYFVDESVISCEYDSVFVIGLGAVECTDFAIKVRIHYNPTETPIPELWTGLVEDWDVGSGNNWGDMDTLHNLMWIYDPERADTVFGSMLAPFNEDPTYGTQIYSMVFLYHQQEVYEGNDSVWVCGYTPGLPYMYRLMTAYEGAGYGETGLRYRWPGYWDENPEDRSIVMTAAPFSLDPGESRISIWIDFGTGGVTDPDWSWERWYKRVLRYAGFYRGDVNLTDSLEVPALDISDLVYLINYLYKGGPAPQPFADQGDCDGMGPFGDFLGDNIDFGCPRNNVDVNDLVVLINYVLRDGPPPVDYVRFIPSFWSRPSLFDDPNWK